MLYFPDTNPVIVDVCDFLEGKIKQRAIWDGALCITPQFDGSILVQLTTTVRLYEATPEGGYGASLPAGIVVAKPVVLSTDNLTAVDTAGNLRYMRLDATSNQVRDLVSGETFTLPAVEGNPYLAWLDAHADTLLLQNFAFKAMCDTQDVRIRTLVEHNIQQANAMGRYRLAA